MKTARFSSIANQRLPDFPSPVPALSPQHVSFLIYGLDKHGTEEEIKKYSIRQMIVDFCQNPNNDPALRREIIRFLDGIKVNGLDILSYDQKVLELYGKVLHSNAHKNLVTVLEQSHASPAKIDHVVRYIERKSGVSGKKLGHMSQDERREYNRIKKRQSIARKTPQQLRELREYNARKKREFYERLSAQGELRAYRRSEAQRYSEKKRREAEALLLD
jgi:hypothetical protein